MTRLVFQLVDQISFFKEIKEVSGLDRDALGKMVGIGGRQYGDWARGKFLPQEEAVSALSKKFNVVVPHIVEKREEWWSGRINGRRAALVKYRKYGYFGRLTREDRSRGGVECQRRIKANPDYYRSLGLRVRNVFKSPEKSSALAEFVGIVLGDGGLTRNQLRITLNSVADRRYVEYVKNLIRDLFGYEPSVWKRKNIKAVDVVVSGVGLVELLSDFGLSVGDKVKRQVGVLAWVRNSYEYSKCCVRGLMDTDGGVFDHSYGVKGKSYHYRKVCLTNRSVPLLEFVYSFLHRIGVSFRFGGGNKVWIYGSDGVDKYFKVVGSSNYRLLKKLGV